MKFSKMYLKIHTSEISVRLAISGIIDCKIWNSVWICVRISFSLLYGSCFAGSLCLRFREFLIFSVILQLFENFPLYLFSVLYDRSVRHEWRIYSDFFGQHIFQGRGPRLQSATCKLFDRLLSGEAPIEMKSWKLCPPFFCVKLSDMYVLSFCRFGIWF